MARLSNVLHRIFGSGAGTDQIAQFGSLFATGTGAFTTDPATAQSLSNWLTGWFGAAIGGNAPAIEDMNSAMFALSYQLAYYQQSGIPEWIATKTYYIGSIAQDGAGQIYVSLTDDNLNNALSDAANWTKVAGKVMSALGDILYGGVNGAMTRLGGNTAAAPYVLSQTGTGTDSAAPAWRQIKAPKITVYDGSTGSGNHTTDTGVVWTEVEMIGCGGGGAGSGVSGAGAGANGGTVSFGTLSIAGAEGAAAGNANGGAGGIVTVGAGWTKLQANDGDGGDASFPISGTLTVPGSRGGVGPYGGRGRGSNYNNGAGTGNTYAGAGGGGGGSNSAASGSTGAGGGGGGRILALIAPTAGQIFAWVVGSGGLGGTTGVDGQAGAAASPKGYILVKEHYQ